MSIICKVLLGFHQAMKAPRTCFIFFNNDEKHDSVDCSIVILFVEGITNNEN